MAMRTYSGDNVFMISFFRRALSSWMVLGLFGLILIAFIVTGVGTPSGLSNLSGGGSSLATIGGRAITSRDLISRLEVELKQRRQETPGLDMAAFVRGGAYDGMLDEIINFKSLEEFGAQHGMNISKKLVDGEIASIPAFSNASGKFDEGKFRQLLSDRGMNEAQFRSDVQSAIASRHMLVPVSTSLKMAEKLSLPYAALQMELRSGSVGVIPSSLLLAGAAPTPQELAAYYSRSSAKYTVPELRTVRYAMFDRTRFVGKVAPTEAEIAAAYNKNAAKYAARDTRGLTQVIVQNETIANDIAGKVRAGTAMSVAAKPSGVDALTMAPLEKAAFANQSAQAVADAVFSAAKGDVIKPVKSGLGWHVVRVDSINSVAAQPLSAVRPTLVADLSKSKIDEALQNFIAEIEAAVSDGQTFDEVVKTKGLAVVKTPAVTAGGIAPGDPNYRAPAELQTVLKSAFQAEPDEDPEVATLAAESFAFYHLDGVTPSAPRPLAAIKDQVTQDFVAERASRLAKKAAEAVAARANGGMPFPAALAASGLKLPNAAPLTARRFQLAQAGDQLPPPVKLMFDMSQRRAKVIEAPNKQGWFIVWLDQIVPNNAALDPALISGVRQQLSQSIAQEYSQQFTKAAQTELKFKRNEAAIAALKQQQLSGSGSK
jgi:peptidyl-prolyl cis-trans isomerase D